MKLKKIILPLILFIALLILLEVLDRTNILNRSLVPSPQMLWTALGENWNDQLSPAIQDTFLHSLTGFLFSFVLGLSLACLLSLNQKVQDAIFPFAIFLQTVPIVAIAPLLVIYLGFGPTTIVASATFVSLFPVLAGTLVGLQSTPSEMRDLFRLLGASKWKTLWHLQLPAAYGSIMVGLKNAAGLSVIGVVSGEFVAGSGLGSVVDAARTQQRTDLVFLSLIFLALIGLCFSAVLRGVHWLIHCKRPFARDLKLG